MKIVELIDFIDCHEELMTQKTIGRMLSFLYGYTFAPKKVDNHINIDFDEIYQMIDYDPRKYWTNRLMEQYKDERLAYDKFVEILKLNAEKMGCSDDYFQEKLREFKVIDSLYSVPVANAMATLKHVPLLYMDEKSLEALRTWLCGFITGHRVGNHQKDEEIDWNEILLYVKNIIKEFDEICAEDADMDWDRFFVGYHVRLHDHGYDLEKIIQAKIERKNKDGFWSIRDGI